jgi:hypothetical protein
MVVEVVDLEATPIEVDIVVGVVVLEKGIVPLFLEVMGLVLGVMELAPLLFQLPQGFKILPCLQAILK